MKFYYPLSPLIIGASFALVQPQIALAQSSTEVSKLAKEITVLIETENSNSTGSGVIIKKQGNTYTVLTAAHVIGKIGNHEIIINGSQRYRVSSVKRLPNLDLAIVQFTSNQKYTVAKIGNSDKSLEGTKVYVTGFPITTGTINRPIYIFTDGIINANASQPLSNGYGLAYSNNTLPGMSGGAVLNQKGELVGIHGRGDTTESFQSNSINSNVVIKTGFNLGIPINAFLRLAAANGVDMAVPTPQKPIAQAPTPSYFLIRALGKYRKRDFKGAIADFTRVIKLNSQYANAFIGRAAARLEVKNFKGAIEDSTQGIKLNPKNPLAYNNRSAARAALKDFKGAIEDSSQAIKINPNLAEAYTNRSFARLELKDFKGAIEDSTQAIKINPNIAMAYSNRSGARIGLKDFKAAIEDSTQAIKINPNLAEAYTNRSFARFELKDFKGAIKDSTQAIEINPNLAKAYNNRGIAHQQLKDFKAAIVDYNQAIEINPNLDIAYANRGFAHFELKDFKAAIEDSTQAIKLNPNLAIAYINRSAAHVGLKDFKAAIEDSTQAIEINPNFGQAYANRGLAHGEMGNKQAAIADLQKAAELLKKQGKTVYYQLVLDLLGKYQQ